MNSNCTNCGTTFEITKSDLKFLEKLAPTFAGKTFSVPPLDTCADCTMQNLLCFRNAVKLYYNTSHESGEKLLSIYPEASNYKVIPSSIWLSDEFDASIYARDVDFSRSILQQIQELDNTVPRPATIGFEKENSDYTTTALSVKNCYMAGRVGYSENVLYSTCIIKCKDCVDCFTAFECELCYSCVDVRNCYNCIAVIDSSSVSDSIACLRCTNINNCFGCVNLKNAEYCIFNEQYSKQEYQQKIGDLKQQFFSANLIDFYNDSQSHFITKDSVHFSENVTGNFIQNSKNINNSYDIIDSEDIKNSCSFENSRDVLSSLSGYNAELCYHTQAIANTNTSLFCHTVTDCFNVYYCLNSTGIKNCFGCAGLKDAEYCIFNKQYSKEEYEKTVAAIIEKMIADEEWGQFFTRQHSPFGYNFSEAQDYFPLTKKEAVKLGFNWYEEPDQQEQYLGAAYVIPDSIKQVDDTITTKILTCQVTGKLYKIIPQELEFYQKMEIPIPRQCPESRHQERMALRNPRSLHRRECQKCNKAIDTTYAPDRPETVYCEACYLSEVY
jgi:hypothetical protein